MTHPHLIEDPTDALSFAFGGRARFTLVSKATGKRFTFRLNQPKDQPDVAKPYFAQLLTGPNNTEDYTYLGFINDANKRELIAGRKGNPAHPAYKALDWTLGQLFSGAMPDTLEFWHEGRCARCAKVLTDPVSIERGLGPECANKD